MKKLLCLALLLAACARQEEPVEKLVADPRVGDVYVVRFRPQNDTTATRYYFYHVFRVTPDSAYLRPARKEATSADADLTQPDFQPGATTIGYTRPELQELLQLQFCDALETPLV